MINYSKNNASLKRDLQAEDIASTALFLMSDLAAAITGSVIYVDNGLNIMGMGLDSPAIKNAN